MGLKQKVYCEYVRDVIYIFCMILFTKDTHTHEVNANVAFLSAIVHGGISDGDIGDALLFRTHMVLQGWFWHHAEKRL